MRVYEIKRGFAKVLGGDGLRQIASDVFGEVTSDEGKIVVTSGALERMVAWFDGKKLFVDTAMKSDVPDDVATRTIKAYNRFLELATGYTAKERSKRSQNAAKNRGP